MAKTVIGRLSAVLSLSNKAFNAGLSKSSARLRKFGKMAKGVGLAVGALGALVVGTAASLFLFVKSHVKALDIQVKFAKRLGIVVGRLQGLHVAAKLAGVDIQQLNIGMQRMGRRVAEASQGMGEAQGALKELGLDARKLSKLSIDRQFLAIADAMGDVKTRGDQVRLTFKLFDAEGVAVLNMLDMGAERLGRIMKFAEKIGATIDQDTARGVERTADALTMASVAWEGMKNVIAVAFMPHVEKIATAFAEWVGDSENVKAAIKDIGRITRQTMDDLAPLIAVFSTADKTLRWLSEKAADLKYGSDWVDSWDIGGSNVTSTTGRIEAHTEFVAGVGDRRRQGIMPAPHELIRMQEGMGDISGNFQNMTPSGAAVSR